MHISAFIGEAILASLRTKLWNTFKIPGMSSAQIILRNTGKRRQSWSFSQRIAASTGTIVCPKLSTW